jgi:hypothetical protein
MFWNDDSEHTRVSSPWCREIGIRKGYSVESWGKNFVSMSWKDQGNFSLFVVVNTKLGVSQHRS